MIKIIYCITRREGMSIDEFQQYWRETHAPIAARIPGVRRYVQCHAPGDLLRIERSPYDGAAELWWDDLDAMRSAMDSPELRAAREDEMNFIDHSKVAFFVTEEKPIVS